MIRLVLLLGCLRHGHQWHGPELGLCPGYVACVRCSKVRRLS